MGIKDIKREFFSTGGISVIITGKKASIIDSIIIPVMISVMIFDISLISIIIKNIILFIFKFYYYQF